MYLNHINSINTIGEYGIISDKISDIEYKSIPTLLIKNVLNNKAHDGGIKTNRLEDLDNKFNFSNQSQTAV